MKNLLAILGLRKRLTLLLSLLILASGATATVTVAATAEEFTQPIAFSHKTHAGTNEIACEFCHTSARRSITSGVPPVRTCIGCHTMVKGTTETQKQEIQKVVDYWDQQKTIPWKKIHDLPDFVYFSHKRHLNVGFDCTECHGDISQKDEITMDNMATDLSMGWCVTCHKDEHPAVDGKVIRPLRATRGGKILEEANLAQQNGIVQGSKDCLICHK
ncbi:MAG: hypothetical protein COB67_00955 [SAR324 cluster bacterium]|uniref:Uncharacterized protein n=1 Tax=SAR324 cluster bacterium TaxID=2024889 RepID=A0A2A4TAV7_9DELT|nr:MAG: hypothetical protein COB67_00955 [SAR324 cluster bacterium]